VIRKRAAAAIAIAFAATLLGYEARASNGALPTRIKSVAVVVIPGTIEPTFARTLERALEDAFAADGTLGVASPDAADSKLTLKIVGFKQQPVKYGVDKIVNEYNLALTLEGTFTDLASDQVLSQVPNIYESVSYAAVGPQAETEYEAFSRLAKEIAPRIVKETILRR
jgi:hypothetical protein